MMTLGPLQCALQMGVEEQAVGKPGKDIVVRQLLQFEFGILELADIRQQPNQIFHGATFVADDAHVLPGGEGFTVSAPLPGLAAPLAGFKQAGFHGPMEFLVVTAGVQQGNGFALDTVRVVTRDLRKGRIGGNDVMLAVGDDDGFVGIVEHHGGLPQSLFGAVALGDVQAGSHHAQGPALGVAHGEAAALHSDVAAGFVAQAIDRFVVIGAPADVVVELGQRPFLVLGVEAGGPFVDGVANLVAAVAQHRLPARRKEHAIVGDLPVEQPLIGPRIARPNRSSLSRSAAA